MTDDLFLDETAAIDPAPPLSLAERIAEAQEAWPWESVPTSYRRTGKPSAAILGAAKHSIGYDDQRTRQPILTLTGSVGVGKTTAACQLASYLCAGWEVTEPPSLTYRLALRMGWINRDEVEGLASDRVVILLLDDLSAGLSAAGLANTLEIVEGRLSWGRRTIVTSSLSLEQLAALEVKHHGREIGVASRLAGGEVLELNGADRRMA